MCDLAREVFFESPGMVNIGQQHFTLSIVNFSEGLKTTGPAE